MHFFIHTIALKPPQITESSGLGYNYSKGRLELTGDMGTLTTPPFEAKLALKYAGFEIKPQEEGITIALVDEGNQEWSFQAGSWQLGGFSTPEQIREGMATLAANWASPLRFRLRLERLGDRSSPPLSELKFGYYAPGNLLAYLMEFSIPKLFSSQPVNFNRWLDGSTGDPIPDVNPDRVAQIQTVNVRGRSFIMFEYNLPTFVAQGNQPFQIEETPCVILRLMDSRNHRNIETYESLRLPANQAQLLQHAQICDQPIEVCVMGQNLQDTRAATEHLIGLIAEVNKIHAPTYGTDTGVIVSNHIRADDLDMSIIEAQLPSMSFTMVLINLSIGDRVKVSGIVTGVETPEISPTI
ncbi:MAG: hypothetical protein KME11_04955 [Timaviella obliquedivisa GSE-PSE-MK23-08B]|jgi:hypothetical protein|nr:hypothetical protein [Timaviella obliquedivisa GSE-PSE-MK23-08B]